MARSTCEADDDGTERLEIDLATFRLQIGYQNPLANFRAALKQIAGADAIPDYALELVEGEAPAEAESAGRRGRKANPVQVVITRRAPAPVEEVDPA